MNKMSPPASSASSSDDLLCEIDSLSDEQVSQTKPGESPLQRLLSLQSAEGWFEAGQTIDDALIATSISPAATTALHDLLARSAERGVAAHLKHVEQTLFLLHLLREMFAKDSPIWQGANDKAVRYLSTVLGRSVTDTKTWVNEMLTSISKAQIGT